jgi:hypothetical protein
MLVCVPGLFADFGFNVTIAAKDRFVLTGLKWHSCGFAALRTSHREHLTAGAKVFAGVISFCTLGFSGPAAGRATPGFIDESVGSM